MPVAVSGPASGGPPASSGATTAATVPASTSGPGVPAIDQPLGPPANHTAPALLPSATPRPAQSVRRAAAHRAPPAGFWVAGVVIVGLGLVSMASLGPAGEPSQRRRGSVLRALERRAAGSAGRPGVGDAVTGGAAP